MLEFGIQHQCNNNDTAAINYFTTAEMYLRSTAKNDIDSAAALLMTVLEKMEKNIDIDTINYEACSIGSTIIR